MAKIAELAQLPAVQAALSAFSAGAEQALALAVTIQQIASPTFGEAARAGFVQQRLEALGLADVAQDEGHNVYGRVAGTVPGPGVVVTAHLDTVFPAGTPLEVRHEGEKVYGPGLADNSTGVAGLLLLGQALSQPGLRPASDVWLAANTCEEGLGDLRGMRAVAGRFGRQKAYLVVEGGLFGHIIHQGVGVTRYRLEVQAPGGHSWGNFGAPSAIHILGEIIAGIGRLPLPTFPKTTYNVGVIEGGRSVNSIAQSASMLLDLRSEDGLALAKLEQEVMAVVDRATQAEGVAVVKELVGSRPAGQISRRATLVQWARQALQQVGCRHILYDAGSTDANIPLSKGWPSVCIGLTQSGHAHRLDEYIEPERLPQGLGQLLLLTLAVAGLAQSG